VQILGISSAASNQEAATRDGINANAQVTVATIDSDTASTEAALNIQSANKQSESQQGPLERSALP